MNNTKIDQMQLGIISLLSANPFEPVTITRIHRVVGKTNYPTVYRKVESLVQQDILSKSMYGKSSQIVLNLQNDMTISLLSLIEARKFEDLTASLKGLTLNAIREIQRDMRMLLEVRCALIFGSYAKGKQRPQSDLDLLVIFEPSQILSSPRYQEKIPRAIKGELGTSQLRGGPDLSPIVVTKEEHDEMLYSLEVNIAKESLNNHVILTGSDDYWRQISAVQKGVKASI